MNDMSGMRGLGDYVGAPPRAGGFGRRGLDDMQRDARTATAPAATANTLSAAAQKFIQEERQRNAEALAAAALAEAEATPAPAMVNDVDFAIGGGDNQYVEIELDPGEAIVAEIGCMIWKDRAIGFEAILGDGKDSGMLQRMVSAGSNALSGEGLFLGEYRHCGQGKARIGLGGRTPGHIMPVRLEEMGGTLVCQKGAFLAAAKGISVSIRMVSSFWTGLDGGAGFILQRLSGTGWAFLHVGGSLIERTLGDGEAIHVEPGCIAAFEPQVRFDTDELIMPGSGIAGQMFQNMKSSMAGVRNTECARLTGPGKVWLQSLQSAPELTPMSAGAMAAGTSIGGALGKEIGKSVSVGDVASGISSAMNLLR